MFRDTLLESAPAARHRKRWPMLLAVALEVTVGSVLVALPLFSTGIIPVSARPPVIAPRLERVTILDHHPTAATGNPAHGLPATHSNVVTVADGRNLIFRPAQPETDGPELPLNIGVGPSGAGLPPCDICFSATRPRGPGHDGPVTRSQGVTDGYLLRKVEPVYPRIALLTGTRGEVRLHAIISKDGTIQSLTVISGPPLLVDAARDAVQQWRYRPYLLNHEPVEVETLITVNFTGPR
jgi:protein TonB